MGQQLRVAMVMISTLVLVSECLDQSAASRNGVLEPCTKECVWYGESVDGSTVSDFAVYQSFQRCLNC